MASSGSHLFTLRVWLEDLGGGQSEWRGKVQHVLSGEARYFRDWDTLITYLQDMLPPDYRVGIIVEEGKHGM
jgi:hypothetical protein